MIDERKNSEQRDQAKKGLKLSKTELSKVLITDKLIIKLVQ